MALEIVGFEDVPALLGRSRQLIRRSAALLAISGTFAIAACSGDSSTGPTPEAGVNSKKSTPAPPPVTDTASSSTTTTSSPVATSPATPTILGDAFWVNPGNPAQKQADAWRASRPADAAQMQKIASRSTAQWFGDWNSDIYASVNSVVTKAVAAAKIPVLVAYNIPSRDCGGLSGGGGASAEAYRTWIGAFAAGLAGRKAMVILEPDALAGMDCLSSADQQTRVDLIVYAVQMLKAQPNILVYLDAGNPTWHSAAEMAARLTRANISGADGFSLNVSNFFTTAENATYGKAVSALAGGRHFVIDTSRNGLGGTADHQWCNPDGRALGESPTTSTSSALIDAYLWIKVPGESDGACNGGPNSGEWWADYALGLVNRSTL